MPLESATTNSIRGNPRTECNNVTCPAAREITIRQGLARWPPEVLRAGGGVGVKVGTAGHVWQTHIYIRMRADWPKQRI
jgi:hypothetical protein